MANNIDSLFQPLENTKPYLKAAIEGFPGSGKTTTAAYMAVGFHKRIQSKKPIVFFDTERAGQFLLPYVQQQGVQVLRVESRSLADLRGVMDACVAGKSDILLIDSISHVYENFVDSFLKKMNRSRLELPDHQILKREWKQMFSDPFTMSPLNIIFCGRAADRWSNELNDQGKREIFVSGVKMQVQKDQEYEPDLSILMTRCEDVKSKKVWREASILKDRSRMIDGKVFKDPTYDNFAPFMEAMLAGAVTRGNIAPEGDDTTLFADMDENGKREYLRRRDIAIEKIDAELMRRWPGQTAAEKKARMEAVEKIFNTTSRTEFERLPAAELEIGLEELKKQTQTITE